MPNSVLTRNVIKASEFRLVIFLHICDYSYSILPVQSSFSLSNLSLLDIYLILLPKFVVFKEQYLTKRYLGRRVHGKRSFSRINSDPDPKS